ncbi:hypothetical protein WJX75_000530 [Coccomyxa subellipsoidea]|uniref:Uncharacterized protein n=1 Tax=Coccomyxa subellipsoidea TaxID=248742 RepID=A0ABR2YDI5_9CHLO
MVHGVSCSGSYAEGSSRRELEQPSLGAPARPSSVCYHVPILEPCCCDSPLHRPQDCAAGLTPGQDPIRE